MQAFKYSVFGFESVGMPKEIQVVERIRKSLATGTHGRDTFFPIGQTLEHAAAQIDDFKAKNCGSAFNFAVINLNLLTSAQELRFLLDAKVLGNPRTIFLGTMRAVDGEIYAAARTKVEVEMDRILAEKIFGAPSCVEPYTEFNRDQAVEEMATLLNAFLDEQAMKERARQTATLVPGTISPALDLMYRSPSLFYGRRGKPVSGRYPSVNVPDTGAYVRPPKSSRRSPPV
ncbi:MAG: hypothetical protein HS116_22755 [Planctomycetes bacterium]|nr:hypothetical protein [Planctomycetota bacterium]